MDQRTCRSEDLEGNQSFKERTSNFTPFSVDDIILFAEARDDQIELSKKDLEAMQKH